jgi:hypothetical protein
MDTEGSLPCSQKPSNGSSPEPHHPIPLPLYPFLFYVPIYVLVFLVVSSLYAFPPITYMHWGHAVA